MNDETPIELDSKLIIATCGECAFCTDAGPNPQDLTRHVYNCHIDPPKAHIVSTQNGVMVMSIRATVAPGDVSCTGYFSKERPVQELDS